MLVGIDIDNTIANTNFELNTLFNIQMESYPDPCVPANFFETEDGLKLFARVKPFPASAKIIRLALHKGYKPVYVTNRPRFANFVTRRWLELQGFPYGPIFFTTPDKKVEIAIQKGFSAFFDDDPQVVQSLIKAGVPVFLKDWPYNNKIHADKLIRFNNWHEIRDEFAQSATNE
jgi:hypothetical protein